MQHECSHMRALAARPGQADASLPTLGVSSLDLGRSQTERPFLCPSLCPLFAFSLHCAIALLPTRGNAGGRRLADPASYAGIGLLQCKNFSLPFVRRTSR